MNNMKKQNVTHRHKSNHKQKHKRKQGKGNNKYRVEQEEIKRMKQTYNWISQNETILMEIRQINKLKQEKQVLQFVRTQQTILHPERVKSKIPQLKHSLTYIQSQQHKMQQKLQTLDSQIAQEDSKLMKLKKQMNIKYDELRELRNKYNMVGKQNTQNYNSLNVLKGQFPQSILDLIKIQTLNAQYQSKIQIERQQIKKLNEELNNRKKQKQNVKSELLEGIQERNKINKQRKHHSLRSSQEIYIQF